MVGLVIKFKCIPTLESLELERDIIIAFQQYLLTVYGVKAEDEDEDEEVTGTSTITIRYLYDPL
jgi:hypothetical protein